MNLSAAAIRRPIATLLLSLALVLAGLVGYGQLAISDLPNIDFPTLQVSATLPGADSETMASAVALPLEQQFSSLPGLTTVRVRQIDAANNVSAATVFRFTLDRSAPSAPRVSMARSAGINLYAIVTRSAALSVQRVERNTVVEYSVNGRAWSTDYVPVEGRNVVRVRQVDQAGNFSTASRALAFRLETRVAGASARSFSAASAPEVFSLMPTSPSRRPTGRPPIT